VKDRARRGGNREKRGEKQREKKKHKARERREKEKAKKKKEEVGVEGCHLEPMLFPVFASSNACKPSFSLPPLPFLITCALCNVCVNN
jgi:hypothetical protein